MRRNDYIIIILMLFTWVAEDLYHLAPREYYVDYFPFSEKQETIRRYIFDIIIYVKFAIFTICILMKKSDSYWITKDIIKITMGLIAFSLIWYLLMYGNPYYSQEWWIKFVSILLIYLSIKAIRYHAKHNNSIYNRRRVHGDD